jgi:AmiR/NasT family two-component response regulator
MENEEIIRILLADDDVTLLATIREIIESFQSYQVIGEAYDGIQAIELTKSLQPDVVLMDILMPIMNGIVAAEQIQRECPTPIIILTGKSDPQLIKDARKAGVVAYLRKPLNTEQLPGILSMAIARFADIQELRQLNNDLQKEIEERKRIEQKNQQLIENLNNALQKITKLHGLLPICARCKKVKDDQGYWQEVEQYLEEHSAVEFSHGLCPSCTKELYPNVYDKIKEDLDKPK